MVQNDTTNNSARTLLGLLGALDATENAGVTMDLILVVYGVICGMGIAGNLLVCLVLLRVPSLRSNTSDFLVHLSLVDLAVCVLVIPFKIVLPLSRPPPPNPSLWGQIRCRLYVGQFLFWVCELASIFSLVTVNLERFVAITYPQKYKGIFSKRKNKLLMITSCWSLAALTKSFILLLYDEDAVVGCRFLDWPSRGVQVVMGVYNFIITLFAPFVFMVSVQWKVISRLKRQVQALTARTGSFDSNPNDRQRIWQLRARQTLVKTLLAFVLTFAICWAPDQLMFLAYNLGAPVSFTSPLYHFGVILAVCNSCVNPIIYTLTNQPFRRGIGEALHMGKISARVRDRSTATSLVATITGKSEAKLCFS